MAYIVIRVYSFECDVPDCDRSEDVAVPTLREARQELRRHGWTRSNEQDVCRYHSTGGRQS